jgi:1-aminocyclopropane-1-carboxylate deaminase/D-cysteine desulfhydrase-like pyridoxal-dependent ACC family enzyme
VPWPPDLPRYQLIDGPSPLHPLPRLSAALGGRAELWIKREDLLPLAFGGNKLRNLEYLVGAALAEGADTLVTSGRRWSNHCRLTAAAGSVAGLEVDLVLSGPPLAAPGPNQQLDELLGARVHVAPGDGRADREALLADVVAGLRSAGRRPFVIPVGGSGLAGALGQALAGGELAAQAQSSGLDLDAVVMPTATGGTQAGLLVGLAVAGLDARVLGFAVAHPAAELRPSVERLRAGLAELAGLEPSAIGSIEIHDAQLGPGYGRPTEASSEATRLLARREGIFVDPIYTAKALAGLVVAVRDGILDGQKVVFWHAGGTPGLFEPLEA